MVTKFSRPSLPFLLAVFLCVVLSSHAVCADDIPTQQNQVIYPTAYIPLKRNHVVEGQPVVQTTLNKTQPATFVIDTGAAFSVLSPEVAKRLNLKLQPATLDNGTPWMWKGKQGLQASLSTLKVGNFTITFQGGSFRILDDQTFMLSPNLESNDTLFDGVLGANILEHLAVLLDASQHTLSLCVPGNLDLYQVGLIGYTAPYVVPISQKGGLWFVTLQLTNKSISQNEDFVLDTGSDQTIVSGAVANHLGLKILGEQRMTNAYSSNVPIAESNVDVMQIGGIKLNGHAIAVAPDLKGKQSVLGMDILSGYRVLIDFPAKKMYLQSNTAAAVPAITIGPTPAVPAPPAK